MLVETLPTNETDVKLKAGTINVGGQSDGHLGVNSGATVEAGTIVVGGAVNGAQGMVTLQGSGTFGSKISTLNVSNELKLGVGAGATNFGTLDIDDFSNVVVTTLSAGLDASALISVEGADADLRVGTLQVGAGKVSTLNVVGGAEAGATVATIASNSTVNVTGATFWTSQSLDIVAGSTVNIYAGGRVGAITSLLMNGGMVDFKAADTELEAHRVYNQGGATIRGHVDVTVDATSPTGNAGYFIVGDDGTVDDEGAAIRGGDFEQYTGGALKIDIDDVNSYDVLRRCRWRGKTRRDSCRLADRR